MVALKQRVNRRSMLLIGLSFVIFSVFFLLYSLSRIAKNTYLYHRLQASGVEIVLQDTGFLYYYTGWVMLLILLCMGIYGLFLSYKGKRPRADKKITTVMGYSVVVGFALMIFGKFGAQMYWVNSFETAGYVGCENSFGMTKSWTAQVWVLDPSACATPFDPHPIWQKQARLASAEG